MDTLTRWLLWLDQDVSRFWIPAWCCFGLALAAMLTAPDRCLAGTDRPSGIASRWFFVLAVLLTLVAFRWPIWLGSYDLNPDEDQMIASALTLRRFPVFWKYVDGTTHGPLNDYLLIAASWVGLPITLLGARIIATFLQATTLLATWGLLRRFMPERPARLAVLPGLCFWAFTSYYDFAQYASEHLAIALVAGSAWAAGHAIALRPDWRGPAAAGLCGLLAGMVPFAKLQLVPLALWIVACAAAGIWYACRDRNRSAFRTEAALVIGGLSFPAAVAVFLSLYGLWGQFRLTYVLANLRHVETGDSHFGEQPGRFLSFLFGTPGVGLLLAGCVGISLLLAWPTFAAPTSRALRAAAAATWGTFAVAAICVITPGREFAHYLQILVAPCCLLAGFHLAGSAWTDAAPTQDRRRTRAVTACFLALAVLPPVFFRATQGHYYAGHLQERRTQLVSPAGQYLRAHARADDTLTVWGWLPRLNVETQLALGTRDAITERQIIESPLRDAFRGRFLHDMHTRQPDWFVDAVHPEGFAFHHRATEGLESFPELAALIGSDYSLVAEFDGIRIFRRRPLPIVEGKSGSKSAY